MPTKEAAQEKQKALVPEEKLSRIDEELKNLIRAKYSLLYVVSWEEGRVIEALKKICDLPDVNLNGVQVWDSARGLQTPEGQSISGGEQWTTPDAILDQIMQRAAACKGRKIENKEGRGPVYVLCDMFRYFGPEGFTPELERKFRVLSDVLRLTNMHVVVVSPKLELPTALEKCVTVVDYPMPGPEELREAVRYARDKLVSRKRITEEDAAAVPEENVVRALQGLTKQEADDAMAKAIVVKDRFDVPTILQIKRQIIRKGQLLDYVYSEESMNSIGGFEGLKEFIDKRSIAFTDAALEYGLPAPRGIFMLGVQGCGKSLAAKAIANSLQVPLLKLDMGRLFGSLMGESESNIKRAIQLAESVSPCVLFLDELDKAISGSQGASTDSGTTKRVMAYLLDWMCEKASQVFLVAAANSLEGVPPAALRKGRFDEMFFVDLPNETERKAIFDIHIKKRKRNPEKFDISELVRNTSGYSGAEIEGVIVDAMFNAFAENGRELDTKDILKSIRSTIPLSLTGMKDQIDALREDARGKYRRVNVTQADMDVEVSPDKGRFDL